MEDFDLLCKEPKRYESPILYIKLEKKPLEKQKQFVKNLFDLKLQNIKLWFDRLNCEESWARQKCSDMTLEKYLGFFEESTLSRLTIRDDHGKRRIISFSSTTKGDGDNSYYLWYNCKFSKENYQMIDNLFKEIFRERLIKYKNF